MLNDHDLWLSEQLLSAKYHLSNSTTNQNHSHTLHLHLSLSLKLSAMISGTISQLVHWTIYFTHNYVTAIPIKPVLLIIIINFFIMPQPTFCKIQLKLCKFL